MILQRYAAAVNSVIIVVLSALLAIPSGQLNFTSAAQLVSIGASGVLLYILPLLNIKWRGILKTGVAIVGAGVAAGFPIFQTVVDGQPFKPIYIALIVLAVAHALGTQVGVDIRTDTAANLPVDNTPTETSANQIVLPDTFSGGVLIAPTPAEDAVTTDYVEPDYFAVGAGQQQLTSVDTATLSAVNPANADE